MTSRFSVAILVAAALALPAVAQVGLSGVVSPQPAVQGQQITLSVTAYGGDVGYSGPIIRQVYQGGPNGTCVWCPSSITLYNTLFQGQSASATWDQTDDSGNQVPPCDYWLKVGVSGNPHFFPVTIIASSSSTHPKLTAQGPAQRGQLLLLDVTAPDRANDFYIAAASFTTNSGIALGATEHLALDIDPLFALTFPNPNPSLFFNLQGVLDGTGSTSGNPIGMFIPQVPFLADAGIAWQVAIFDSGGLELTNALNMTIQ